MKNNTKKVYLLLLAVIVIIVCVVAREALGLPNDTTSSTSDNDNCPQNSNQTNNNQNLPDFDIDGYSQILQNILTNEYYDELIYRATVGKEYQILESGLFEPHPYAFLESQGIDVDEIKNDQTEAYTMSYVLDDEPNNLYIHTRVLQDDSYWVVYLLKYQLTDKEMDDYHYLHKGEGSTAYFIQSVLMNNEIAKTRTPEIVGTSKIDANSYVKIDKSLQRLKGLFDTEALKFILVNPGNRKFDLYLAPTYNNEFQMCYEHNLVYLPCSAPRIETINGIYKTPVDYGTFNATSKTEHSATYYYSQDASLYYEFSHSLENKK